MPSAGRSAEGTSLQALADIISSEGLTSAGVDGRPVGRLAERWSVSPDGLTWRFLLRPGIAFQDGSPCEAAGVKLSLDRALADPAYRVFTPGLLDVARVDAVSPSELVVTLRRRSAFLIDDLGAISWKPGPDGRTTGPFFVTSTAPDEIVLQANRHHYLGAPAIDRILLKSFGTLRTAWASLMRGEVDVVSEVAYDALEFVGNEAVAVFPFRRPYVYTIVLNLGRPALRSPLVRRALNAAINRDEIVSGVLKGLGQPATDPIWPLHWARDPAMPPAPFDPALAASLVDQAAPVVAAQRAVDVPPARLRFTCLVPEGIATLERLALVVQRQLWAIGVDMKLEAVAPGRLTARIQAGNFDAAAIDLVEGISPDKLYVFWHSPSEAGGLNVFGYRNPEADRALDDMRHAADDNSFRAAVARLQRVMRDDPPALFLAWSERARAVSRRFEVPATRDRDVLFSLGLWRPRPDAGRRRP